MSFWQILGQTFGVSEKHDYKKYSQKIEDASIHSSLSICTPVNFDDITRFVITLRKNEPVIVNFSKLNPKEADRCLDFVCGAICVLDGKLEKIGEGIFIFVPAKIKLETDKKIQRKRL
jgi:FtsZ-interacting cell division protein YlmF